MNCSHLQWPIHSSKFEQMWVDTVFVMCRCAYNLGKVHGRLQNLVFLKCSFWKPALKNLSALLVCDILLLIENRSTYMYAYLYTSRRKLFNWHLSSSASKRAIVLVYSLVYYQSLVNFMGDPSFEAKYLQWVTCMWQMNVIIEFSLHT